MPRMRCGTVGANQEQGTKNLLLPQVCRVEKKERKLKQCGHCKCVLPDTKFYKRPAALTGLRAECQECSSIQNNKSRTKHRVEINKKLECKRKEIRARVLTHYGNGELACVLCGFANIDALSIDHVRGGGNQHRRQVGIGNHINDWLVRNNYPEGFRTLCMNCQFIERRKS